MTTAQAFDPGYAKSVSPRLSTRLLGVAWGVWIGLFPFLDFIFRPPINLVGGNFDDIRVAAPQLALALVSLALGGTLVAGVGAARLGVDFRRAKLFVLPAIAFCLIVPISLLATTETQNAIYTLLIFNLFLSLTLSISTNVDADEMLRNMFTAVAVTHALMMIVVLVDHDFRWGRLFGRNTPNYWGFVAQTALIATIAMRGWVLRVAIVGLSLAIIYLTQSRGSMAAVAVGMAAVFILYARRSRVRVWLWLAMALIFFLIALLGADFIADDLLHLSDPGRGLASGASGRASVWRESFDLFANHPWIGVGYRQHEQYLTSEASAHDAYLAMLADTGVLGFLAYIALLFGGITRAVLRDFSRPSQSNLAIVAFLIAFAVNGLFERSALNTGNAYCQMMALLAAWAWRHETASHVRPLQARAGPVG